MGINLSSLLHIYGVHFDLAVPIPTPYLFRAGELVNISISVSFYELRNDSFISARVCGWASVLRTGIMCVSAWCFHYILTFSLIDAKWDCLQSNGSVWIRTFKNVHHITYSTLLVVCTFVIICSIVSNNDSLSFAFNSFHVVKWHVI